MIEPRSREGVALEDDDDASQLGDAGGGAVADGRPDPQIYAAVAALNGRLVGHCHSDQP